jgi:small conductance mechanosensitive channel
MPPTREFAVRQAARRIPAGALRARAADAARRGRRQLAMLVPVLAGLLVAYSYRKQLFGVDKPVRIAVAAVLILLGWAVARNVGRLVQPRLEHRLEPGTAGILGFVVQLLTLSVVALVSLRLAGLDPGTLAAGAGFTAIVIGLATQQTFGNIFAGIVLLSARPFQVGDRVRFAGLGMDVEGTVAAHGLLHVTLYDGDDPVLIPNNSVLSMSARPILEPDAVDMRARLPLNIDPEAVQERVARRRGAQRLDEGAAARRARGARRRRRDRACPCDTPALGRRRPPRARRAAGGGRLSFRLGARLRTRPSRALAHYRGR